eukprot:CAMPEP_0206184684 /NCGR_PEP_ID=MMETSP0166-20121206/1364_1 /ASSEMBLY_ACC=CAM_ASM_000260 /TAXON_ID=95228 /ORGANISM="Vannella robusta, Strain DIVA3 518/3/11/1/6" /LENGTH=205 /DNA_ID=CAMNT_0053599745 /DNA_START=513 /DNA_END=1130 /DNA_ORIENTATION=+
MRKSVWIGTEKCVQVLSLSTGKKEFAKKVQSGVFSLLHVEFNNEIWVGLDSGEIMVLEDSGTHKLSLFGHDRKVNSMRICEENVWSASSDGTMRIWTISSYEFVKQVDVKAPVLSIESEKSSIWGISHTGKLNMWDGRSLTMVHEVSRRVQNGIISITLLPVLDNGKVIGHNAWVTSSDKIVSIWKIITSNAYKEMQLPPTDNGS